MNDNQYSLEERIARWVERNPDRAYAGYQMIGQLGQIRTEFKGAASLNLQLLVEETLNRMIGLQEAVSRKSEIVPTLKTILQKLVSKTVYCISNKEEKKVITNIRKAPLETTMKTRSVVPEVTAVRDLRLN